MTSFELNLAVEKLVKAIGEVAQEVREMRREYAEGQVAYEVADIDEPFDIIEFNKAYEG